MIAGAAPAASARSSLRDRQELSFYHSNLQNAVAKAYFSAKLVKD